MDSLLLIAVPLICFAGAWLSTVAAMGGGLLIVAASSQVLPLSLVVPLTSVFLLTTHMTRTWQFRDAIDWRIAGPFIPGSVAGALLGAWLYLRLPDAVIALLLAGVVLWFCWVPTPPALRRLAARVPQPWFWTGIIHTFIATISGLGGLLQAMMANSALPRQVVVGTVACTMFAMAVFKTAGFLIAGFDYVPYLGLIGLGWLAGILGTAAGRRTLHRVSDRLFRRLIKILVTLFALRLLWEAVPLLLRA